MAIGNILDDLIEDIMFVLWWTVPAKIFKWNLNWLRTITYKRLILIYIGLFLIKVIIKVNW